MKDCIMDKFSINVWLLGDHVEERHTRYLSTAMSVAYGIVCEHFNDERLLVEVIDNEIDECVFCYRRKGIKI